MVVSVLCPCSTRNELFTAWLSEMTEVFPLWLYSFLQTTRPHGSAGIICGAMHVHINSA